MLLAGAFRDGVPISPGHSGYGQSVKPVKQGLTPLMGYSTPQWGELAFCRFRPQDSFRATFWRKLHFLESPYYLMRPSSRLVGEEGMP